MARRAVLYCLGSIAVCLLVQTMFGLSPYQTSDPHEVLPRALSLFVFSFVLSIFMLMFFSGAIADRERSSRSRPARAMSVSYLVPPTQAPVGICWQCGRRVKPEHAICGSCGATQVSGDIRQGTGSLSAVGDGSYPG